MRSKRQEITGALYEEVENGLVRVTQRGRSGLFRATGEWVEGGLTDAELHMLIWVGGPDLPGGATNKSVRAAALLSIAATAQSKFVN